VDFWQRLELILAEHEIVIDRPQGSRHPRFLSLVYPLDYGYLHQTSGSDGQGVDVWKGSLTGNHLVAVIGTADSLKNDIELKLLVDCTEQEITIIERFYNTGEYMSGLVVRRH
jgi:inorganic pyrophosphatase